VLALSEQPNNRRFDRLFACSASLTVARIHPTVKVAQAAAPRNCGPRRSAAWLSRKRRATAAATLGQPGGPPPGRERQPDLAWCLQNFFTKW